MKFSILKRNIEDTVDFLSNYIDNTDSFIPFRCINFELNTSYLTLTSATSTMEAKKVIQVDEDVIQLERTGRMIINANILKNIIKKFDKRITFDFNDGVVDIYEGTTRFELTTIENEKFPIIDFSDSENKFEISSRKFEKVVSDVSVSTSSLTERLNVVLYKCINLRCNNDSKIRFSATDSYRLSTETLSIPKNININATIDAKNLKKIITKDAPNKVSIFFNNSKFGVSYENTVIQTSLLNLNYLDIQPILQTEYNKCITIEKDELSKLINKAIFINSDKARRLQFSFKKEGIKVVYEVPEIGTGEAFTKNYELDGNEFDIDIDYQYIKDAVNVLENGTIKIKVSPREDKLLFTSNANPENIQLITPLRRY
ncbi:DNA polymerase III subunit beta [Mycoplasma sp. NEAQ87857]|uniref:DNA polymerase III subunit beta n=1 Tax=Mycoplasma sp. NEAQ87857 TaxID=2683967 RepID=UPI0013178621|nr:DNA polymerase III subunit beta [Mycoplasma sp. NEAQ87857]QGZ97186.1 DNA polymerase III subunit beta [Mycoplasma sp. NEAQ87857]